MYTFALTLIKEHSNASYCMRFMLDIRVLYFIRKKPLTNTVRYANFGEKLYVVTSTRY